MTPFVTAAKHEFNPGPRAWSALIPKLRKVAMLTLICRTASHSCKLVTPGGLTSLDIVNKAMRAVIQLALLDKTKSIAFPGLGTGVGKLDRTIVADTMVSVCQQFDHKLKIKIIDPDEFFIRDVERYMGA